MAAFRKQLEDALGVAYAKLREEIGRERLYAFAIYTSGEEDFGYVAASANTEEALARSKHGESVRWSAGDWEWHDCSEEVSRLKVPAGPRVYADFLAALKALDRRGVFGKGKARPMLAVMCGDMSDAFLERSLAALNPKPMFEGYRLANSPGPYLEELARLPAKKRLDTLLALYRELSLGLDTPRALDARRRHITQFALAAPIAALGPAATPRLLDLVEEFGFAPFLHPKAERAKLGAFTREAKLALGATTLAAQAGLADADVARMQSLIARRVEVDRGVDGTTSPLAASLARHLHERHPDRFPAPVRNPKGNRLENSDAFTAAAGGAARAAKRRRPAR